MRHKNRVLLTLAVLAAAALAGALRAGPAQSPSSRANVWDAVYTNAQASRGKAEYEKSCIKCHAASLVGIRNASILGNYAPRFSLRGTDFMDRWREIAVYRLFNLIKTGMPPHNQPGVAVKDLSEQAAIDLTAYIMQRNGFPAGKQALSSAESQNIQIQGRGGPKPLPSLSLVQVVGCLKQSKPGVWELAQASAPIRFRELTDPTPEELAVSASEKPGNLEFALVKIGYVGKAFVPADHESHKMEVRGALIKQPDSMRIDVWSLVEVAPNCAP